MQDTATLGKIIAENVLSWSTIHIDEWAAYSCIPNLVDVGGVNMNYVWRASNC